MASNRDGRRDRYYEDDYREPAKRRPSDGRRSEDGSRRRESDVRYRESANRRREPAPRRRDYDDGYDDYDDYSDRRRSAAPQRRRRSAEEARRAAAEAAKKRKKKRRRIVFLIVELIALLGLVGVVWFVQKGTSIQKIKINEDDIVINDTVAARMEDETLKGYRNIALFGVDARDKSLGKGNRSDTIIIASINEDTGDVKLCSVFRDTYLNLGNDTYNKCNAAYAKGGPEQAINMLNMNLDLNITDYVTVGFTGLAKIVDALGGVTIDVKDEEIVHLNNYQISMVGKSDDDKNFYATEGKDYTAVKSSGVQRLNGLQATAYCRIRYVGNDFVRAERQRNVIGECLNVAKQASPKELAAAYEGVSEYISTSLDSDEIISLLGSVGKYNIVGSDGFPFESNRATGTVGQKGSCVIPVNLEENVVLLQQFLFDDYSYTPSSEVTTYSNKVSSDTGY